MSSLGPYSDSLHLNSQNWLNTFPTIDPRSVNNGLILEINSQLQAEENTANALSQVITSLKGIYNLSSLDCKDLKFSFSTLKLKRVKLAKSKSRPSGKICLESFLGEAYIPPGLHQEQVENEEENINVPQLTEELARAKQIIEDQSRIIRETKKELEDSQKQLNKIYSIVGKVGKAKHVVQKLKRKDYSLRLWKTKHANLKKSVLSEKLHRKLHQQKENVKRLRAEKRAFLRKQQTHKRQNSRPQGCASCHHYLVLLKKANAEVSYLQNEQLERLGNDDFIQTKEGKSYSTSIREASYYMYLQDLGMSERNTSHAIRAVVGATTGRKLGPLPSVSTQNRFSSEMKALSESHIHEKLAGHSNLTLKYDGTTKSKGHLTEVEISSPDDTFLLGCKRADWWKSRRLCGNDQ